MPQRLAIVTLVVLLASLVGLTPAPAAGQQGEVPMDRANPARTGEMPGPGPEGNPATVWRFSIGGTVISSPAVVNGVVYVGSQDGYLYAISGCASSRARVPSLVPTTAG